MSASISTHRTIITRSRSQADSHTRPAHEPAKSHRFLQFTKALTTTNPSTHLGITIRRVVRAAAAARLVEGHRTRRWPSC